MKDEIAIMLEEGENTDAIKNYFVNQYGPQVLGEPPREGFNLMAWILPFVVLLGGGVFLLTRGRKIMQSAQAGSGTVAASPTQPTAVRAEDDGVDPYGRLLDEELARYD
jgi:cytochrome c-type biogenesis protein CcmH